MEVLSSSQGNGPPLTRAVPCIGYSICFNQIQSLRRRATVCVLPDGLLWVRGQHAPHNVHAKEEAVRHADKIQLVPDKYRFTDQSES